MEEQSPIRKIYNVQYKKEEVQAPHGRRRSPNHWRHPIISSRNTTESSLPARAEDHRHPEWLPCLHNPCLFGIRSSPLDNGRRTLVVQRATPLEHNLTTSILNQFRPTIVATCFRNLLHQKLHRKSIRTAPPAPRAHPSSPTAPAIRLPKPPSDSPMPLWGFVIEMRKGWKGCIR